MNKKILKRFTALLSAAVMLTMTGCTGKKSESSKNTDEFLSGLKSSGDTMWVSDDDKYEPLTSVMKEFCSGTNAMGSIVLANDENIIFAANLNAVEADNETPVSVRTTYEIGSLTKTFMSVAIMQLAEQGKLGLDDTLDKYFPDHPYSSKVTMSHLLHMQSGFYDYVTEGESFFPKYDETFAANMLMDKMTDEEFLKYFYEAPMKFEPGERTFYCSTNYHILAMILEKVTGEKYADYMKENVIDPSGMVNTSCSAIGDVTSYPTPIKYGEPYTLAAQLTRGEGDMHSSAADVIAFDRAFMGNKLVSESSVAEILDTTDGYGAGWYEFDKDSYWHVGTTVNYQCANLICRSEKYGNIYLVQLHPTTNDTYFIEDISKEVVKACKE